MNIVFDDTSDIHKYFRLYNYVFTHSSLRRGFSKIRSTQNKAVFFQPAFFNITGSTANSMQATSSEFGRIVSSCFNRPYYHSKLHAKSAPYASHLRFTSSLQFDLRQQPLPTSPFTTTTDDKQTKLCFIFPGMGSQYTGMCKDLALDYPYISTFLEECDEYLGIKLSDMMFNSDSKTLAKIEYGSVAVFIHSMCVWRILQNEYNIDDVFDTNKNKHNNISPTIIGHSMGEYAALTVANLFKSFKDAISITNFSAQIMKKYTTPNQAMCAIVTDPKNLEMNIINNIDTFNTICDSHNIDIANINTPNQVVLSGYKENIDKVIKDLNCEQHYKGTLRHKYLEIKGAYHSYLMRPVETESYDEWHGLDLNTPSALNCEIYLNVIGDKYDTNTNEMTIADIMSGQLYKKVHWHDCIKNYFEQNENDDNVEYNFIEIGPRNVLQKMIAQICSYHNYDKTREIKVVSIDHSKSVKLVEDMLPL